MIARSRLTSLLALLAAFALPLLTLTRSLGSDEASSVWFSQAPAAALLLRLCDPHPPAYYLLLAAWQVGGDAEFWLRFPSLLASVLSVALLIRLTRAAAGARAAGWTGLLLATFPLQTWYAGEVRMYSLVQLLSLLMAAAGWRLLQRLRRGDDQPPGWQVWLPWLLSALAALFTDYAALPVWWLLQLAWLHAGSPQPRRWWAAQAGVGLPWLAWWIATPQAAALATSYHSVFIAVQAQRLGLALTPTLAGRLLTAALLAALLLSLAAAVGLRRSASRSRSIAHAGGLRNRCSDFSRLTWLTLLALCLTPGLLTVKRQLVVLLPLIALGMAAAWSPVAAPRRAWPAAWALLGLIVTLWAAGQHPHGEPWRETAAQVAAARPSAVWVDELAAPAFAYYAQSSSAAAPMLAWTPLRGRDLPALPSMQPAPGDALWIISAQSRYRNLVALLPPAFGQDYELQAAQVALGIGEYRYQRRRQPLTVPPPTPAPDPASQWGLLLPSPLATCD